MIVAIHQPNYAPWLGFFHKMAEADLFVYLDVVQFSKNGYQNRVQIKSPRGAAWLTVPVITGGRSRQATMDVLIDGRAGWSRAHLAQLGEAYARSPGWAAVRARLEPVLKNGWERLVPLNVQVIELLREMLGVTTPTVLASEIDVRGRSTDLLLDICRSTGADTYLSGRGADDYLETERFAERGVSLRYQEFTHPAYLQPHGRFVPGLSTIDLLCAEGGDARSIFLRSLGAPRQ